MGNINEEKSVFKIARVIFDWEIGMSCALTGFIADADSDTGFSPKGKLVIKELQNLYNEKYLRAGYKDGKQKVRARNHYTNSIGGAIAHPIWRYKEEIVNDKIKYTIWRVQ